ncbi:MAG: flagellar basal body rod protein FlgB [Azonexus sp.]|jgi:flagellar basal-body rod protein FlgB|nr:flagellar basal body rod protein FlgB [Azonexus sp.]
MNIAQNVSVYSQALNLRIQRHQVLASNIANADTPNYQARDFDFADAMHKAMGGQMTGGLDLNRTAAAHLAGGGNGGAANLQYRQVIQGAVDGNTVDMDVERAAIGENALQYQILTQLISNKFQGLRNAMASTNG